MDIKTPRHILAEARAAASRFPLAALCCAAGCAVSWAMIASGAEEGLPAALLQALCLGAALFSGLHLLGERWPLPAPLRPRHALLAGAVFLVFYFHLLASNLHLDYSDRYAQAAAAVLLLASFAPFLGGGTPLGLWQFCRRLVTRAALSALYTVVLFAGVSLALGAVDKLLGVDIPEKAFGYLWSFAGLVFWPLHFLAGVPRDLAALDADASFPRGLKLFTQYVLVPLAGLYFLILYVYLGKVLVTQQWPQGWVTWLTGSASLLGLLAFLLLYPAQDDPENAWIRPWARGFCAAALPLLGMLLAAVYKRVDQYGLTEHRYFMAGLALWLAGVFLYLLLSRRPDIRRVPVSLALLAALTAFGPWGAYSVSLRSQIRRLERLLDGNGLLLEGKAVKAAPALPAEVRGELSGALDYIVRRHGTGPLVKYFAADQAPPPALKDCGYRGNCNVSRDLMSFMGQEYLARWAGAGDTFITLKAGQDGMDLRGYDLAARFSAYAGGRPPADDDGGYRAVLEKSGRLRFYRGRELILALDLASPAGPLRAGAAAGERVPASRFFMEGSGPRVKGKAYFYDINARRAKDGAEFSYASGVLLLKGVK